MFSKYGFSFICLAKISGKEVGETGMEENGNGKAISNVSKRMGWWGESAFKKQGLALGMLALMQPS